MYRRRGLQRPMICVGSLDLQFCESIECCSLGGRMLNRLSRRRAILQKHKWVAGEVHAFFFVVVLGKAILGYGVHQTRILMQS